MTKQMLKAIDDIKVQAMLFDMDIDWEAFTLVPKNNYKEPIWVKRWKASIEGSAADPAQNLDKE